VVLLEWPRPGVIGVALAFLMALGTVSGCAGVTPIPLDASKSYRMDLAVESGAPRGVGVLTVPLATSHAFRFRAEQGAEITTIRTCHREEILERTGDDFRYAYVPTAIERENWCPLRVAAYSKARWYQAAIIGFQTQDLQLPGILTCNGKEAAVAGAVVCQARAGLAQELRFSAPVDVATPEQCARPKDLGGGIRWELVASPGECLVTFLETGGAKRRMRVTLYGYEEFVPPR
jgi:hypothetical protein